MGLVCLGAIEAVVRWLMEISHRLNPIFLLSGAPAVGKSTTGDALAAEFPKSIHIRVDDLRDMVVSGLRHPGIWDAALSEQLALARESAVSMARIYRERGYAVVIDDFYDPHSNLAEYADLMTEAATHRVLLYPSEQAAQQRNLKRAGSEQESEYIGRGVAAVYEYLAVKISDLRQAGWWVIDTTDTSVAETVSAILAQAAAA
jgi:predicted kinase